MKLTVVVPTYNRSELLKRALCGLLTQTAEARDYEIVVVDDGSVDDTAEVVKAVGASKDRLRYYRQENKGPAAARNLGVREAMGEIILFTGDDCVPDERFVAEHIRIHKEGGDVGVIGFVTWHPEIEVTPLMAYLEMGPQFGFQSIEDPDDAPIWHFYTANCSVRKHWLEEVGGFDEDFKQAAFEDIELAYRMKERGLMIVFRSSARTYHYHPTTLEEHLKRQRVMGRAATLFWRKHPELQEELAVTGEAQRAAVMEFYKACSRYAFALGVRDELGEEGPPWEDELEALSRDPEMVRVRRAWAREVLGTDEPEIKELLFLRNEMRLLKEEYLRVTSRRLHRWSEAVAKFGWGVVSKLRPRRKAGGD